MQANSASGCGPEAPGFESQQGRLIFLSFTMITSEQIANQTFEELPTEEDRKDRKSVV